MDRRAVAGPQRVVLQVAAPVPQDPLQFARRVLGEGALVHGDFEKELHAFKGFIEVLLGTSPRMTPAGIRKAAGKVSNLPVGALRRI
ncbi:hypothetical protein RGQ21_11930 [Kitasatospora aureofaciens]|nr:hypothetical protein RGQ21_11930 [Kitasatospora aureofaciens]